MKTKLGLASLLSTVAMLGSVGSASAATIYSPVSAVINSGGPGFGSIAATYNQNGLVTNFASGVDNFATYIALNPLHTFVDALYDGNGDIIPGTDNEWFSESNATTASITYDLGSILSIDRLALWNEDLSGIGSLNLSYSTDNINFMSLASSLTPSDNVLDTNYTADVFSFAAKNARYIKFDASGCPQPGIFNEFCAIGEVAFSGSAATPVPEPSGIVGTSVLALGLIGRKVLKNRNKQSIASKFQ